MYLSPFLVFLGAFLWFGALQAVDPVLADPDGYFHIRFASLGPSAWIAHDLPAFRYTIFDDGQWVDHQLLFHLALWPFTWIFSLPVAAKVASTFLAALACATLAALLERQQRPGIWALLLPVVSWFFDFRMMMPRAQSLSLVLLLLGLGLAWEGRRYALLILGFVFAWTYHVSLLLIPLVFLASRERLQTTLYAALGLGLGFALHPQSPYTFGFLYLHTVVKVLNLQGLAVGAEWAPADTRAWLSATWPVLGLLAWNFAKSRSTEARSALWVAAGMVLLSMQAAKWLEYAVPFGLLAALMAGKSSRWWLLPGLLLGLYQFQKVETGVRGLSHRPESLQPIADALPAEDCRVANPDWSDFAILYYLAPQCRFLGGLDPHFLAVQDPKRQALLDALQAGTVADISAALNVLDSDYLLVNGPALEARAEQDPGLQPVVRGEDYALWRRAVPSRTLH